MPPATIFGSEDVHQLKPRRWEGATREGRRTWGCTGVAGYDGLGRTMIIMWPCRDPTGEASCKSGGVLLEKRRIH